MSSRPAEQTRTSWNHQPRIRAAAPEIPAEYPDENPSTGTVDDDDDPADERPDENEAPDRANSENTEAPEEFERDDADGDRTDE